MKRRATLTAVAAVLVWPLLVRAAPRAVDPVSQQAELPGKPTGPIAVEHRLAAQPAAGVPLRVSITARAEGAAHGLSIAATATAPRAVLVTPPTPVDAAEGVFAWELTVVPLAAEAGYLSVIVSGEVDGVAQARSVTLSLRSAPATADTPAAVAAGGETLIALPVQESP